MSQESIQTLPTLSHRTSLRSRSGDVALDILYNLLSITSQKMSIISSLLDKLFPKSEFRCLTIGLDASGKTTLLYKMKLGEVVTTIPTIGFNVETVVVSGVSLTIWDVGGCDKIRPLWRHYYQNTEGLIFVVDCNDIERIEDVLQLFVDTITADELKDSTVLILFNKIDIAPLPRKLAIKEQVMSRLEPYLRSHVYHTEDVCATTGENLLPGYIWLTEALQNRPKVSTSVKTPEPTEKDKLEVQLEEWLTRIDESDDRFLAKLADYTLDSWDHYTHLRIAFVLLHKHGRREGMKMIFDGIKKFIENSPRTRRGGGGGGDSGTASSGSGENTRGTTFHETMTYFWVHMVHYAIESTKITAAATGLPEFTGATDTSVSPWKRFLLMNPQLANGGLFLHYYSKQRMLMDPDARAMVLLPDKLPLPSLLVDVHQLAQQKMKKDADSTHSGHTGAYTGAEHILPRAPLSDAQFVRLLVRQQLPGWGHEVKLRVIFLLLCRWGISGKSKAAILYVLRDIEKEAGFHYTLNYFWVHLVAYHIATAIKGPPQGIFTFTAHVAPVFAAINNPSYQIPNNMSLKEDVEKSNTITSVEERRASLEKAAVPRELASNITSDAAATVGAEAEEAYPYCSISFADFFARPHCQKLRNSLLYSKYYSRSALNLPSAATDLVMPDFKQLPSAV